MRDSGTSWLDGLSIGASGLCLLHCLALPLVFASAPMLSELLGTEELVHRAILLFAIPASTTALLLGFRTHRHALPPAAGCLGLGLMIAALCLATTSPMETLLTVSGSIVLTAGHFSNWHLRRRPVPTRLPGR